MAKTLIPDLEGVPVREIKSAWRWVAARWPDLDNEPDPLLLPFQIAELADVQPATIQQWSARRRQRSDSGYQTRRPVRPFPAFAHEDQLSYGQKARAPRLHLSALLGWLWHTQRWHKSPAFDGSPYPASSNGHGDRAA
jgi:hypothetical protein